MRRLLYIFSILLIISLGADSQELKQSLCFENLFGPNIITFEKKANLDEEVVIIGFQYPGDDVETSGGMVIFAKTDRLWMPAYGVIFSKYVPKDIRIDDRILTISLEQYSTMPVKKTIQMVYQRDFDFLSRNKKPFGELKVEASSLLKKEGIKAQNVVDFNFDTAWAEGAEGTGIDESIVIKFKNAVNIGMVGVIPGLFSIPNFKDNNRVHRGKIKLRIEPPKGEEENSMLFSVSEEEIDMSFPNRPNCSFFDVRHTSVKELKIQITSVYLGDKNDDAYISEIFIFDFIDPEKYGKVEQKGKEETKKDRGESKDEKDNK
ncbi:MAG: NADase-type glycan-binding domain-containing protein [Myxococcota bacterium]